MKKQLITFSTITVLSGATIGACGREDEGGESSTPEAVTAAPSEEASASSPERVLRILSVERYDAGTSTTSPGLELYPLSADPSGLIGVIRS